MYVRMYVCMKNEREYMLKCFWYGHTFYRFRKHELSRSNLACVKWLDHNNIAIHEPPKCLSVMRAT